jgi:hypothetical protein
MPIEKIYLFGTQMTEILISEFKTQFKNYELCIFLKSTYTQTNPPNQIELIKNYYSTDMFRHWANFLREL